MTEMDRLLLDDVIALYPRSSIHVAGGFLDGTAPGKMPRFGYVPDLWDGTTVRVDFRSEETRARSSG